MLKISFKRATSFFAVALLFALTAFYPSHSKAEEISVEKVEGAETIDVKKAKELFDAGTLFVDSRSKAAYDMGRIPGSENIAFPKEPKEADYVTVKAALEKASPDKNQPIVMYCNGIKCPLSAAMTVKALEWGYKKLYYFRDGYPAWKEAGYATE